MLLSSLLCVEVLPSISHERVKLRSHSHSNLLELVQALLPTPVAFHSDLNTAEYLLLAALEIYSELYNVTVVHGISTALHAGAAEAHVIEKGAGAALDILDEPLAAVAPHLAVPAADDLALEADRGRGHWV